MSKKKIITWVLIVIAIVGGAVYFFRTDGATAPDVTNYPPKNSTIVAFGDSLTSGMGSSKGNDYVTLLSEKIELPIVNKGVPGDTSTDALKRLDSVTKLKPGVVILYIGGNDFLRRVSTDVTFSNIEKIIARLQENGSVVVLVGIRGGLLTDQYGSRFKSLAEKYKTYYVQDMLLDIIGMKNHMHDAIHPNDAGYEYIAETIYDATEDLFENVKGISGSGTGQK